MQKLRERMKDQKGFTLVEMLIVVAIIAILVAVSMPMVSKSLEKARHAVDQANMRDAISLANIEILTNINADGSTAADGTYYYFVDEASHQGALVKNNTAIPSEYSGWTAAKSQCTGRSDCGTDSHKDEYVTVVITGSTGKVEPKWSTTAHATT